jgi:hypothetical protein
MFFGHGFSFAKMAECNKVFNNTIQNMVKRKGRANARPLAI